MLTIVPSWKTLLLNAPTISDKIIVLLLSAMVQLYLIHCRAIPDIIHFKEVVSVPLALLDFIQTKKQWNRALDVLRDFLAR